MPTRTEAIKRFLEAKTHADLAALYCFDMECQVNVAQDNGTPEEGEFKGVKWRGYTDGFQHWKSFRIPYKASTAPEYTDSEMNFDLVAHTDAIGMTGWDWRKQVSRWVAFDFDAITGHSEHHAKKLTPAEMNEVEQAARNIPWVTIRKSTSGKGLHIYVFLKPVSTATHTEHAALARAILGQMSAITGFSFSSKVDNCGGNMWVWGRKMVGTDGLTVIKQGERLEEVPSNWRDHMSVTSGQKKKVAPVVFDEHGNTKPQTEEERIIDELCGKMVRQPLDAEHKKLIDWLQTTEGVEWWWDSDNHMLITHTVHLADAHRALGMKGIFKTISSHSSRVNCFAYPMRNGMWVVRRYSQGVAEAPTWTQDSSGWTRCYLNREPDLPTAAREKGALEHPSGGYVFQEAELAVEAIKPLGALLKQDLPPGIKSRHCKIKQHKDGRRLIFEIEHDARDNAGEMPGWLLEGGKWKKILDTTVQLNQDPEIPNYDDLIRHLVTETGEDYGWLFRSDNQWRSEPLAHLRIALSAQGVQPLDVPLILGSAVSRPWTVVNRPFQPEYLGDRVWNRKSAQFRFLPSNNENRTYPHWHKVLTHCGKGLDDAIQENPWCKANGILTGADYLKLWIASLFQEPTEPLPYLFFWSKEQATGKTTFYEAISLLITNGVIDASAALLSASGFNAELVNSVLCFIEEKDLRKNTEAYDRIKDWVTSLTLLLHKKGETPYTVKNTTHWIHCTNNPDYCPIFPGDTRITMIHVEPLDPLDMIPRRELLLRLEKEAPDFLAEVLNLEIPKSNDRLNVPIIATDDKRETEGLNQTYLEKFIAENCYYVSGELIKFSDFYDKFIEWLPGDEIAGRKWSKIYVGRNIPLKFIKARHPKDGQFYIGNMSWKAYEQGNPVKPLIRRSGEMLVIDEIATSVA